ncbi:MAG: hypothetical protein PVJ55_10035 [Anaerolineae bacterium]|jgi:hypothetical protein
MDRCAALMEEMRQMYDLGLVRFRVRHGEPSEFARDLSAEWEYEEGEEFLVLGCRWAAVMADGETVIAAVRQRAGELEGWVKKIKATYPEYELNPNGEEVELYYKDKQIAAAAHDGMP